MRSWHWLAVARTLCSKLVSFTQLQWCQSRLPIHSSLVAVWFGFFWEGVVHNLNPVHLISCTCSLCLRDIDTMIWHCGKYKTIGEVAYWLKLSHVIKASFWPSSALWGWMPFDRPKAGLIDSVWSFNLHKIEQRIKDIVGCQIFHHFFISFDDLGVFHHLSSFSGSQGSKLLIRALQTIVRPSTPSTAAERHHKQQATLTANLEISWQIHFTNGIELEDTKDTDIEDYWRLCSVRMRMIARANPCILYFIGLTVP